SEVKGVTTKGGKTTTQYDHDNNTNVLPKGPLVVEPEKPVGPNDVLTNDQPQMTSEPVVQPSNEVQTPPVSFPRRLRKEKEEAQQKKFLENLKQLHINLPFIEALAQMPKYAISESQLHINNALVDLGASISLMPYTMYKKLGLGEPKATRMSLELADRSFLGTARAMIYVFNKKITLRVGEDEVIFDLDQSIKRPTTEDDECYGIDDLDDTINQETQELLTNEEPNLFLSRENSIRRIDSDNTPYPVTRGTTKRDDIKSEHLFSASANEIDGKKLELKSLPQHLEYTYLHRDKSFPIIISSKLSKKEKM
ncbi:reverse transcriptase domain-containing protein, partial [Tanacetum coccineum]